MAPAVAPGAEVGGPRTPVSVKGDGHLGHPQPPKGSHDHHLAGELHARGGEAKTKDRVASEGAQSAVEVTNPAVEEQPSNPTEHWVADDAVGPRHRGGLDVAAETITHNQVVA